MSRNVGGNGDSKMCNNQNKSFREFCNRCKAPRVACSRCLVLQKEVADLKTELQEAYAMAESASVEADARVKEVLESSDVHSQKASHEKSDKRRVLMIEVEAALAAIPNLLAAMEPKAAMDILPSVLRNLQERLGEKD